MVRIGVVVAVLLFADLMPRRRNRPPSAAAIFVSTITACCHWHTRACLRTVPQLQ